MVKITRGNVVLDVNEDFLQTYLNQGYNVVNENGDILKRGVPNDITSLKLALSEAEKEINSLREVNAQLTKKIEQLTTKKATVKTNKE